jgi:hypothetical protein
MKSENRVKCDMCGETFSSPQELNRHNLIEHEIGQRLDVGIRNIADEQNITATTENIGDLEIGGVQDIDAEDLEDDLLDAMSEEDEEDEGDDEDDEDEFDDNDDDDEGENEGS